MKRGAADIPSLVARLAELAAGGRPLAFMEVCGTHTVSAFRCGLHSLMPDTVLLVSGPGCPVCVTSQGDIDRLIELGGQGQVTLCIYGDMLRVTGASGSLEQARGRGADVRVIYSALDAVKLAAAEPTRQVVLGAVGFETTTPATAVAVREADRRGLANFSVLASHKLVIPAMRALLDGGQVELDGFLCPGHVSVILGAEAFRPIVDEYRMPCAIAGFEPAQMAAGMLALVEAARTGKPELTNLYPQAVRSEGNRVAARIVDEVFEPADVRWRALGVLPQSGLKLRPAYQRFDAVDRFALPELDRPEPPGCRCGEVITGRCTPAECQLFGTACTPLKPIGPCMVSSEGTCQAWFKYRRSSPHRPITASGAAAEPVEVGA